MKFLDFSRLARVWSTVAVVGVLALAVVQTDAVHAQSTSADLRGRVTDADGSPISGASVEILHVPSETRRTVETGDGGQFFQSGLRVGGPYRLTVRAEGHRGSEQENVFLEPGSQNPLRFSLDPTGGEMDTIRVVGRAIQTAEVLNNGVGSTYDAEDIENQPTTDRDVIRTLLRDPLAQSDGVGNLSVGGVNPRFNGFAIDGSLQQDDFGLSSGTYATARSPINLDAIESATLVSSDYSVTASGFTGGLVNVVTKSGTNEFDGNLYYAYKDDSFVGNSFDGGNFDPGTFEEEEYGFTLGGPIVKDKLFFFLSYDEYENAAPADFTTFDQFNGVQPGFFEATGQLIQDAFGFDPMGRPQVVNVPETSERLLAKVDWNITENHRASFTYQDSEESDVSTDPDEFVSAWYDIPLTVEAYTAELFSDWSPNFSTNFRINFKENARGQICRAGSEVGEITLDFEDLSDLEGTPLEGLLTEPGQFVAGCDIFRHANDFEDERLQIFGSGEYFAGDHVLTFGGEFEEYELFNLFVFASRGDFTFDTPEQLINRNASSVFYQNVPSNNVLDGAANWGYDKWSFFVQDRWAVTPEFELSLGLRYERFEQDDRPQFSQAIFDEFGVRTDNNLDGNDLIMPRIGFQWSPRDRMNISGGFGLFAGGDPKVWTSNAFQQPVVDAFGTDFENVDIRQVPQELLDRVASGTPVPIDFIGDDFDTPSDWKASLRFEQQFDMDFGGVDLGENYLFTAQWLYTESRDGFIWENIAQTQRDEALPAGEAPDGRPIYADLQDLDIPNLTKLLNADGNKSNILSVALAKRYDNGINFDVSYAYQDAEVISEGTSSRGISNWRSLFTTDRNNPTVRTSPFEIEHSFKINFGYERAFFGDLVSRVDLFGRIFRGDVWSTSFDVSSDNALFGRAGASEGPFDNNPLYIPDPGGDSRVVYASGFDVGGFFDYVDSNDIPTGGIHDPYSEVTRRFNNIWSMRLQQELPGIPGFDQFVGDNNFKLILDVDNVLNLINSSWGRVTNGPSFGQANIVRADLVSAADVAENGIDGATALTGDAPRTTCQQASDCLFRYNTFDDDPVTFTDRSESVYEIRLTLRYDF